MKHRRTVAMMAIPVSFALAVSAQLPVAAAQDGEVAKAPRIDERVVEDDAPTRFIVKFTDSPDTVTAEERTQILNGVADDPLPDTTEVRDREDGTSIFESEKRMNDEEIQQFIRNAEASGRIEYIEEDVRMYPMTVNDPQFSQQWALNGSAGPSIETAWANAPKRGDGQTIAVLDTGITAHPDLDQNVRGGYDFISDQKAGRDGDGWDENPRDEGDWEESGQCGGNGRSSSWHGTHVAGISAAVADNGEGVASVAPRAAIQPVRIMGPCGGYSSDIIDAMDWASGGEVRGASQNPNPAKIINMSLGGQGQCSRSYQEAVDRARSRGTVVVVAAGNENQNAENVQPASCRGVITVAASGPRDQKSSYSNYGASVDVTAPGGDDRQGGGILATYNSGSKGPGQPSYSSLQGTSMASPYVAGVVALMLAENPGMNPDQVAARLRETARPLEGSCNGCGTGIVDPAAAVGERSGDQEPPALWPPAPQPPRNPGWDDWDDGDPWLNGRGDS
ncbi:Extracellular basic protease precursor [Corynebacterium glaucum]|uniref:Extracellular basic protease n=1 Tax=Corynebacterium glaucum TaxID=187491 RepID=A0A1Q2HWD2_9CORY|nr:S8 family peptidase [Corynebacterium glaucum]AQQ15166.1 Extracellular basic protease precursor [Corynebacterium glaucum]